MKTVNLKAVGRIVALLLVCLGAAAWAADGTWTNTAGGTWSTDGNWQGSVKPNIGHANLTLTGVDYGVTYNSAEAAISNLVVQNSAGKQTTLTLDNATLAHLPGSAITLSTGAKVYVTNNAVWTYSIDTAMATAMSIGNGAELTVSGGTVGFTNRSGTAANIYVGSGSTGTLRVTAGTFSMYGRGTSNAYVRVGVNAGGKGTLEVADGATMRLGVANDWWVSPLPIGNAGGRGKATISGTLDIVGGAFINTVGADNGGAGELILTNNATVTFTGNPRLFAGNGNNCSGILRVSSTNAAVFGGTLTMLVAGNNSTAGTTSTGLVAVTASKVSSFAFYIGQAQPVAANAGAVGTLDISGGTLEGIVGGYGTWIGWAAGGGQAQGTLNMSGGVLDIKNQQVPEYPPGSAPNYGRIQQGLVLGACSKDQGWDDPNSSSRAKGTMNLSGGTVTNVNQLAIGVNGATGVLYQTGGAYVHIPRTTAGNTNYFTMIGYGYGTNAGSYAGDGTYEMAGGSFVSPERIFVAGVPTNVQWYARGGTVGRLKVAGGSFVSSNTVYVGANGSGTLTIGSNGTCTAGNLVMSNNTASVLRFEVSSTGAAGQLVVTNKLMIATGAKLEVYVPASYTPDVAMKVLTLATYASKDGAFAPADITVSNRPGVTVVQTATQLQVRIPNRQGTMITIR